MLVVSRLLGRQAMRAGLWLLVPLCVAAASAIWSAPARAVKQPVAASATVEPTDSCNAGAIDPNETVKVKFWIRNSGSDDIVDLVATLQATGGVTNPSAPQIYGAIAKGGGTTVDKEFTFTAGSLACGEPLVATLALHDQSGVEVSPTTISYELATGKLVAFPLTTGDIAVPIPDADLAGVEIPIVVPDLGSVAGVKASFRLDHTWDSDLIVDLIHPDGTVVNLVNRAGVGEDNFGTGTNDCSGTPTVIDDNASTAIADGVAPFAGSFIPETPLAALKGKPSQGTWRLRVADFVADDIGTIGCFKLEVRKATCCGAEIRAWTPVTVTAENGVPANGVPDPGETLTAEFPLINLGASDTTDLVATLQATGGVGNPSGAQSYGVLASGGPAVGRPFTFTAAGTCGGTITATLALQDGTTNLGTVSFPLTLGVIQTGSPQVFTESTPIYIPANQASPNPGVADPYPSNIAVSGVTGNIGTVTVGLRDFSHKFPPDVSILVVSPTGRKLVVLSKAGGDASAVGTDLTLDDRATTPVPEAIVSGTFRPTSNPPGRLSTHRRRAARTRAPRRQGPIRWPRLSLARARTVCGAFTPSIRDLTTRATLVAVGSSPSCRNRFCAVCRLPCLAHRPPSRPPRATSRRA